MRARLVLFASAAIGLLVLFGAALTSMPEFGSDFHPYRELAVAAATSHRTANVVSSVNFDQRGLDTLGEELILLCSVVGATALLQPGGTERHTQPPQDRHLLESTGLAGYLMLPIGLLAGADLVVHGVSSPGGGFQGGVVFATGLHLVYIAGSHRALRKLRPLRWYSFVEAGSAAAFLVTGLAALATSGAFLANLLPYGRFGELGSGGTVTLLNVIAGGAVAGSVVVLLAQFLEADLRTARTGGRQ
ncbi:MnhB domain-containing protein [Sciscionella sediminilitoris]|uniref:MnhB domain-containing protein n=1 Tax=Sciscionella sediminilitoris TaxID=1445613 RepID=UPI0006919510|nr:MnhB domain-containing protein [Sciscionella sp. SE31]